MPESKSKVSRLAAVVLSAVVVFSSIPDLWSQTIRQVPAESIGLAGVGSAPAVSLSAAPGFAPALGQTTLMGSVPAQFQQAPLVSPESIASPMADATARSMAPSSEPGGEMRAAAVANGFFDGAIRTLRELAGNGPENVSQNKEGDSAAMAPATLPRSASVVKSETVLFPDLSLLFSASNREAVDVILHALQGANNRYLVVGSPDLEGGDEKGTHRVASLVRVGEPDITDLNALRVTIEVVRSVVIKGYHTDTQGNVVAELEYPPLVAGSYIKEKGFMEAAQELAIEFSGSHGVDANFINHVVEQGNPTVVASMLAQQLPFPIKTRQEMLGLPSLEALYQRLIPEMKKLKDSPASGDGQANLQPSQPSPSPASKPAPDRPDDQTAPGLKAMIEAAGMPAGVLEVALREVGRLAQMNPADGDAFKIRTYLQWLVYTPWSKRTVDRIDMKAAKDILDRDHTGLESVKKRVMQYLAVRKRTGNKKGTILCFAGPPGVGKTSIASAIAEAMGRKFVRLALGGIADETQLRGHGRTYQGSQPGEIIAQMRAAGTVNPVVLLDEVDKIQKNHVGDPMAALLEILDPQQNGTFRDHYMEVPYDLSEVLFIVTANDLSTIPAPLRDRMEIIEFSGYTLLEKVAIAENHVVPEKLKANGLTPVEVSFTKDAIRAIVERYTMEAGVRSLRERIDAVMRSVVELIEIGGEKAPGVIADKDVIRHLGSPRYSPSEMAHNDVGVGTGLAVNEFGGSTLNVEVVAVPGHGQLVLRQQMLKMTNDSAHNAYAYVKSKAYELGLAPEIFEKLDVEMQFSPAHDIDGPSAGSLMATTIVSRLTNRKVKDGVAMTGEITLTGHVLPIGGLKQKVMAAQRMGFHTVIFPYANLRDVDDIPKEVRDSIRLVPVKTASEVFAEALEPAVATPAPTGK